jgi:hypothetical protein
VALVRTADQALIDCLAAGTSRADCDELIASQLVGGAYCDGNVLLSVGPQGEHVRTCVPQATLDRKATAAAASPLPSRACAPCASLPSSDAAGDLVAGKPGALVSVVGTTLLRAGLIGAGAYVAGERDLARLARVALGGALAIEAFVLVWVFAQRKKAV